jgi:hypothetical protein
MVVDGFGSGFGFGLVWIIGSSLLASSLVLCGQQPLSSVGNNSWPLWNNIPYPLWDSPCPLWDTPPSVVTFSFNWLVWSVGQILG